MLMVPNGWVLNEYCSVSLIPVLQMVNVLVAGSPALILMLPGATAICGRFAVSMIVATRLTLSTYHPGYWPEPSEENLKRI